MTILTLGAHYYNTHPPACLTKVVGSPRIGQFCFDHKTGVYTFNSGETRAIITESLHVQSQFKAVLKEAR